MRAHRIATAAALKAERGRVTVAALVFAVALCDSGTADAREPPPADVRLATLVQAGDAFWSARWTGPLPCPVHGAYVAGFANPAHAGEALVGGCRFEILDRWMRIDPTVGHLMRLRLAREECVVALHEYGHAIGLGHSPGGLMAADGAVAPPVECRRAARRIAR